MTGFHKRKGNLDIDTEGRPSIDHVQTNDQDGHLQAKEASEENSPADTLIMDFWPPEL